VKELQAKLAERSGGCRRAWKARSTTTCSASSVATTRKATSCREARLSPGVYAIPYEGEEVKLHWANARSVLHQDQRVPAFRLAAASEGEHNNVKEGQERYFLIHSPEPVKLETNAQSQTELVIQFQYRPDPEKTGQAGTWQQKRLNEAEAAIQAALADLPQAEAHRTALATPAPTDKQPNRTLLGKYLGQYTSRNTMDYFIHKNLGGFLRRELDFYIKNEIMRLDDIENAEAPRVDLPEETAKPAQDRPPHHRLPRPDRGLPEKAVAEEEVRGRD
jgi:hypothetical protein